MAKRQGFWSRVSAAFKGIAFTGGGGQGYSSYWGWPFSRLPGAQIDYRVEAGNLWENGIVLACIKWQGRTFPEAPFCVRQEKPDGTDEIILGHPLTKLIAKPNPYYSGPLMWQATLLSLTVDGNAYWYIERSKAGKPVSLIWLPHWSVEPRWSRDGNDFIDHYNYRVNGKDIPLKFEDVVHFRDGMDPENYRKGLSPLGAILREVVTDNEAATFSAAILRNSGIPGVFISPKADASGGMPSEISPENAEQIKREFKRKFTGDGRGEPMIMTAPFDITQPGFSPEQLVLDKVRQIPEERITAALSLPAIVVGMGAGLERSTFANMQQAVELAWRGNLIPLQRIVCAEIDVQLLPFFTPNGDHIHAGFDLTKVWALQPDQDKLFIRVTNAVAGPWLTPNEGRAMAGLKPIDAGDELVKPAAPVAPGKPGEDEPPAGPKRIPPAKPKPGKDLTPERQREFMSEIGAKWREMAEVSNGNQPE